MTQYDAFIRISRKIRELSEYAKSNSQDVELCIETIAVLRALILEIVNTPEVDPDRIIYARSRALLGII